MCIARNDRRLSRPCGRPCRRIAVGRPPASCVGSSPWFSAWGWHAPRPRSPQIGSRRRHRPLCLLVGRHPRAPAATTAPPESDASDAPFESADNPLRRRCASLQRGALSGFVHAFAFAPDFKPKASSDRKFGLTIQTRNLRGKRVTHESNESGRALYLISLVTR